MRGVLEAEYNNVSPRRDLSWLLTATDRFSESELRSDCWITQGEGHWWPSQEQFGVSGAKLGLIGLGSRESRSWWGRKRGHGNLLWRSYCKGEQRNGVIALREDVIVAAVAVSFDHDGKVKKTPEILAGDLTRMKCWLYSAIGTISMLSAPLSQTTYRLKPMHPGGSGHRSTLSWALRFLDIWQCSRGWGRWCEFLGCWPAVSSWTKLFNIHEPLFSHQNKVVLNSWGYLKD